MRKIELIKDTNPIGEVIYFIKVDGWCITSSRNYDEAEKIYNTCIDNIKNGKATQERIKMEQI